MKAGEMCWKTGVVVLRSEVLLLLTTDWVLARERVCFPGAQKEMRLDLDIDDASLVFRERMR